MKFSFNVVYSGNGQLLSSAQNRISSETHVIPFSSPIHLLFKYPENNYTPAIAKIE